MSKFIELSHIIETGMLTYSGLPGPIISDHMSRKDSESYYSDGTTFQIGKIEMIANTGTYIDAPFHRLLNICVIWRCCRQKGLNFLPCRLW